MNGLKRLTALIMALCISLGTAALAVACGGEDNTSQTESSQGSNSSTTESSQSNSSSMAENAKYTLTVAVVKEDGAPLSGISFTLTGYRYEESATTDAEGKAAFSGASGTYTLTLMEGLPEYHYADVYSQEVTLSENTAVTVTVEDATPDGSEAKPYTFFVDENGEMAATLPANATYHYDVYRAVGQSLVIENENVEVTFNGTTYAPVSGEIVVPFGLEDMRDKAHFTVTNKSASELQLTFKLQDSSPVEELVLALDEAITASVTGDEAVVYTWTATANGVLKIVSDSKGKSIGVSVAGSTDVLTEEDTELEVEVNAGDVVTVSVSAISNSAGLTVEIVFTATFAEATAA